MNKSPEKVKVFSEYMTRGKRKCKDKETIRRLLRIVELQRIVIQQLKEKLN